VKILLGVDGSEESFGAERVVAERRWPAASECHIVTTVGPPFRLGVEAGAVTEQDVLDARAVIRQAEGVLAAAGPKITWAVLEEDPRDALVRSAETWCADSIFVGSRGLGRVDRFLLGSVSLAVATRAPCSVEIIR